MTQLPEQLVSPVPHVAAHAPIEQTWPPTHGVPHAPQLFTSAAVLVSHPFAGFPSQSAKPGSQAPRAQVPALHSASALAYWQRTPHPPQLLTSLALVAVSQPFDAMPSQSPKPVPHAATAHLPLTHASFIVLVSAHEVAQSPQCVGLVFVSTQLPPQLVSVAEQELAHAPELHTRPLVHASPAAPASAPQPAVAPQWRGSVAGSTHVPSQLTWLPGQDTAHTPPLQTSPLMHESPALPAPSIPQPAVAPQCCVLVRGSTQRPPPQSTSAPEQGAAASPCAENGLSPLRQHLLSFAQ